MYFFESNFSMNTLNQIKLHYTTCRNLDFFYFQIYIFNTKDCSKKGLNSQNSEKTRNKFCKFRQKLKYFDLIEFSQVF